MLIKVEKEAMENPILGQKARLRFLVLLSQV